MSMALTTIKIPDIPEEERTPLVATLLEIIHLQREQIQALKDENAQLKGQKPKPKIKPSNLEKNSGPKKDNEDKTDNGKRPGSEKRKKTAELKIHETKPIKPDNLPEGSRFKGHEPYTVQDIVLQSHNTVYLLERWETPEGKVIVGKLPAEVFSHFGVTLVCFVLYLYYHAHVTQPLILEQLLEVGVDISAGQVNRIITEGKDRFHKEKEEILRVGLEVSNYVNVDDTSARHQGKNGYCTHIGNELFAWFESTESKSRINFLKLLRGTHQDYMLNSEALDYMKEQKLPKAHLKRLADHEQRVLANEAEWEDALANLNFTGQRHIRIATEGALLGSVLEHGINPQIVIVSDDAGQFNILLHALCWIHAERSINKLIGFNDQQREALKQIRTQIWEFYAELKAYKQSPSPEKKVELDLRFDEIFNTKTCCVLLNQALKRIHKNKSELLLVLERPELPLHNNLSEGDIREYVKKKKISGSTRSERGRRCRDTFTSLKKTCRKLRVSFWDYLKDRISGQNIIAPLPDLIRQRAQLSPP